MTLANLAHKRMSPQATEAYIRSQIKWFDTSAHIRFEIRGEQLAELNGEYVFIISAEFIQFGSHNCTTSLSVFVSAAGNPLGVYASDLATCLL
jgi:hypothetical protein